MNNHNEKFIDDYILDQKELYIPDISYFDDSKKYLNHLDINLNKNELLYELNHSDDLSIKFENNELDITLSEFEARSNAFIVSSDKENFNWDEQNIFIGTRGDDIFTNNARDSAIDLGTYNNIFKGTSGSDLYKGSFESSDLIDYSDLESSNLNNLGYPVDTVSGLIVTNNLEDITLSHNDSPLLANDIYNDPLLVYKSNLLSEINTDQIDILEDIEVMRLTPNDDILYTNSIDKNIYDFISGDDQVILTSRFAPKNIYNYINLDKITWRPLDINNENIINIEDNSIKSIEFKVEEAIEDRDNYFIVEDYNPSDFSIKSIEDFKVNELDDFAIKTDIEPSWFDFMLIEPLPEIINQGRAVIQHKVVNDPEDSTLNWLEIHAFDYRSHGKGLIGLDIDIEWNNEAIEIDDLYFKKHNVFIDDTFPIFQNLGTRSIQDDNSSKTIISGLGAGSLPVAGQGTLLGHMKEDEPLTQFARIPFRISDASIDPEFNLKINSAPASKGLMIDLDNILVVGDHSPQALVVFTQPDQSKVGSHILNVSSEIYNFNKNFIYNIRSFNDSPIPVDVNKLELDKFKPSVFQDEEYLQDLNHLFFDEENENLIFKIVSAPDWLSLVNNNFLGGSPNNIDVGIHEITIEASDGFNSPIEQTYFIEVKNINDAPEIIRPIDLPILQQGQSINYSITNTSFYDKDIEVDSNELLTFELVTNNSSIHTSNWITVNKQSGEIVINTNHETIGKTNFSVKATDNYGLSVEQNIELNVENINDSPFITSEFPGFDKPITISVSESQSFNISTWFDDFDLGVDPNETLIYNIFEDTGTGELREIDNSLDDNYWLKFDSISKSLSINPKGENIGNNYLLVKATDSNGLESSAIVPINVNYKNNPPAFNYYDSNILKNNTIVSGVNEITTLSTNDLINEIIFDLNEQDDFVIDLPFDLFSDIDIGIDPNEKLEYSILNENNSNLSPDKLNSFLFKSDALQFSGNTIDLALNTEGGFEEYKAKLVVRDNFGLESFIDIRFKLQRTIIKPNIILPTTEIEIDEGNNILLSNLFSINHSHVNGELLTLNIKDLTNSGINLSLFDRSNNPISTVTENWIFSGTLESLNNQINNMSLGISDNPYAIGDIKFGVTISSSLGETGLISNTEYKEISYKINAVPNTPVWSFNRDIIDHINPYEFQTLDSLFTASSPDPKEVVSFFIKLPEDRIDLYLTDINGNRIGESTNIGFLLTQDEWSRALIRSDICDTTPFNVSVSSTSTEPSTLERIKSVTYLETLIATPLIDEKPSVTLIEPFGYQNSGVFSTLSLLPVIPSGTKSLLLSINLPTGSEINFADDLSLPHKKSLKELNQTTDQHIFNFDLNNIEFPDILDLMVKTKDSFSGKLTGKIDFFASSRDSINTLIDNDQKIIEISNNLASQEIDTLFNWDVVQIAKEPEFFHNDKAGLFNNKTGEITIGLIRGISEEGYRNPKEEITVSLSNIPNGYALAQKSGESFTAVGATDKFGTVALFTINSVNDNANSYEYLNNLNLYLASKTENFIPIDSGSAINVRISSMISGQESGDSRSSTVTGEINLNDFVDPIYIPALSKTKLNIDPLIINLDNNNDLKLTNLYTNSNVAFSMLPGSNPLRTAWIDNESNKDNKFGSAFIAYNNLENDTINGVIEIKSITELFSEYFQSTTGLRTFLSGSDALRSFDSDENNIINSSDLLWNDILLWFDDGDAISTVDEIYSINNFVSSIDLNTFEIIEKQPDWASGNQIISKLSARSRDDKSDPYSLYDVGLNVNPTDTSTIDLEITSDSINRQYIKIIENGEPTTINFDSSNASNWVEDGTDSLTLIRLSGLPDEISPSLGVKDSRGDWLFTWADLHKNSNQIKLFSGPTWSGSSNLSFLLTQLDSSGSLINSPLISYGLYVEPIPTKPILILNNLDVQEDHVFALSKLVKNALLVDNDGSEKLHFEISNFTEDFKLYNNSDNNKQYLTPINNTFEIAHEDLKDIFVESPLNYSGKLQLEWKAIATESATNASSESIVEASLNIIPKADTPSPISSLEELGSLIEGKSVKMSNLINTLNYNKGLFDIDGSEEIRYELEFPKTFSLFNYNNTNWTPLQDISDNQTNIVLVSSNDLPFLEFKDEGTLDSLPEIIVTRISREIQNGDEARSTSTKIIIPFHLNARPALITYSPLQINEDSDKIMISKFLTVEPFNSSDKLTYYISNLDSKIRLIDQFDNVLTPNTDNIFQIEDVDNYFIKPIANISGEYSFDISTISTPNGMGDSAISKTINCLINISPVADVPTLTFTNMSSANLEIKENGWFDFGELGPNISSEDIDNSEDFSLLIANVDANGDYIPFPSNLRFNVPYILLEDGTYEINSKYLNNFSLYLNKIIEDLNLFVIPKSNDSSSYQIGETTELKIMANLEKVILKIPLLEVRGVIQGEEDVPVPIIASVGGVVNSMHRGDGIGQSLFLEVDSLPSNTRLVQLLDVIDNKNIFSGPINVNESGELLQKFILPYHKWDSIYFYPPKNQSGDFQFNVKSISKSNKSDDQISTRYMPVKLKILPVNDTPLVANINDLSKADEATQTSWNLRDRFTDVDNTNDELSITAKFKSNDGSFVGLPSWLTLDSNGLLIANPTNNEVGNHKLLIQAIDPYGLFVNHEVNLDVGNINQKPFLIDTYLSSWTKTVSSSKEIYSTSMKLNESKSLSLNSLFSDIDSIHGDTLSFEISNDGLNWSDNIPNLATIQYGLLSIVPKTKSIVGDQDFYLRAIDKAGSNTILNLSLNILNVNEIPFVDRNNAIQVNSYLWEERIELSPDKTDLNLDLRNLFVDPDIIDIVEEIYPTLPSWITFKTTNDQTGGILTGKPSINNIGTNTYDFNAYDQTGTLITYRLTIDVKNVNDPPVVKINPDLSSLGQIINDIPNITENSYTRLDPNLLFDDEDYPFGDSLSYKITKVSFVDNNNDEKILEDPDWIDLKYNSTDTPEAVDKFLIEPIFYKMDEMGLYNIKVDIADFSNLEPDTSLKVVVSAIDNRISDVKGLIGVDLDISVSNSLKLIDDSILITDKLPLFNKLVPQSTGFRIEAGSAPDLGIGQSIGNIEEDNLVSFNVILKEPELNSMISITPGIGEFRDGLTTRDAVNLDSSNSIVHSISNQEGASIEILSPSNKDIGLHKIYVQATDQSGETVETFFLINITNINENPVLNTNVITSISDFLNPVRLESTSTISNIFPLFTDPDLIHSDSLNVILRPASNDLDNLDYLKYIAIQSDSMGNIRLKIDPPKGLQNIFYPKFIIEATDKDGLMATTANLITAFSPKPDVSIITSGESKNELKEQHLGSILNKNITINLMDNLNINAIELLDNVGDEVFLNIKVKSSNSSLITNLVNPESIISSFNDSSGDIIHTINLNLLSKTRGTNFGDLKDINLQVEPNLFSKIPQLIQSNQLVGIPLDIWTSTRVINDTNNNFGSVDSNVSKVWIPIRNSRPVFTPSKPYNINESFSNDFIDLSEVKLFELSKQFTDSDPNEILSWEIDLPDELIGLISINENGDIHLSDSVVDFNDLPIGAHRIIVLAKDSSSSLGESNSNVKGLLRLNIADNSSTTETLQGLSLINRLESSEIKDIFSRFDNGDNISEDESDLVNVFRRLNVSGNIRDSIVDKLVEGSAAILGESTGNLPLILLDSSSDDELLLLDSSQTEPDENLLVQSNLLFESKELVDSPIGQLDFSIDTTDKNAAFVDLYMEDGGIAINELIKTNYLNKPNIFNSELLTYNADLNPDLESWLDSFSYSIYDYSSSSDSSVSLKSLSRESDLSNILLDTGFSDDQINMVDGSAYLIDLDGNSTIDLISMLILDQGFFDVDTRTYVIEDPLIPVQTISKSISSDSNTSSNGSDQIPVSETANNPLIKSNPMINTSSDSLVSKQLSKSIINEMLNNNYSPLSESEFDFSPRKSNLNPLNVSNDLSNITNRVRAIFNGFSNNLDDIRDSLNNYFEKDTNNTFLAILGFLALPFIAERSITPIAKNLNLDYKLKLLRRESQYNGNWIFKSSDGNMIVINRNKKGIYIKDFDNINSDFSDYELIQGFDILNNSILYKLIKLSSAPGVALQSIHNLQTKFTNIDQMDINWDQWLETNLFSFIDTNDHYNNQTCSKLSRLIAESNQINPSKTDIVMLAHIIEVCNQFDISFIFNNNINNKKISI